MKRYVKPMAEVRKEALKKWRLYNEAVKVTDLPIYKDLKKVYTQLKKGALVLDINEVFKKSGVRQYNFHPKLAIAQVTTKKVYCRYWEDGKVRFLNQNHFWLCKKHDVEIKNALPEIPKDIPKSPGWNELRLSGPVPIVPPQFLPKKVTKDYYVLWEVETWTPEPPKDPYLLKRITNNMFVVLAAWDLTKIERAAMRGRI